MSTGAYVRIERDGQICNVEIDQLTDMELDVFAWNNENDGWRWAKFLAKWIRDNVRAEQ